MSHSDVGRNDPCPCGSGAKYKHCCLREERRSTKQTWTDKVDQRITSHFEHGPPVSGDAREETEAFFEAWQLFVDNTDPETRTLDTLDGIVDSDKDVDLLLRYAFEGAVRAGKQHRSLARRAVDIIEEALEIFEDPVPEWRWLGIRDRTELQLVLGEYDEAEAGARWLLDNVPEQAAGYGLLADVLLERDQPDPEQAVDILERGLEEATHPPSWDLEHRLASARGAQTGGDADDATSEETAGQSGSDTGDDTLSWSEFWDRYKDSSMDERLELARRQIEADEQFDNEWVFELVANRLWHDAQEHGRMEAWLDLAELTRERHPDAVEPESAALANKALVALVLVDRTDERGEWVDMLLSAPSTSPENVDSALEMLAYHSLIGDLTDQIARAYLQQEQMRGIGWSRWLMTSVAAQWADNAITTPRTAEDAVSRLNDIDPALDEDALPPREGYLAPAVEAFFGPFDESTLISAIQETFGDEPSSQDCVKFAALVARWLVEERGWPPSRGWMTFSKLFIHWNRPGQDAEPPYAPNDPDTDKLREALEDEHWMLPNPALVKETLNVVGGRRFLPTPWLPTCLMKAAVEIVDLFDDHDLANNDRVLKSIRYHFKQRFPAIAEAIRKSPAKDPDIDETLDELRDRL